MHLNCRVKAIATVWLLLQLLHRESVFGQDSFDIPSAQDEIPSSGVRSEESDAKVNRSRTIDGALELFERVKHGEASETKNESVKEGSMDIITALKKQILADLQQQPNESEDADKDDEELDNIRQESENLEVEHEYFLSIDLNKGCLLNAQKKRLDVGRKTLSLRLSNDLHHASESAPPAQTA